MKKLSGILVVMAIVAAAFLVNTNSNDTNTEPLSLELASALETIGVGDMVTCKYDPEDKCRIYTTVSILHCDEDSSNSCADHMKVE
jgi:uncharacterized protein (UPF0333 family)